MSKAHSLARSKSIYGTVASFSFSRHNSHALVSIQEAGDVHDGEASQVPIDVEGQVIRNFVLLS